MDQTTPDPVEYYVSELKCLGIFIITNVALILSEIFLCMEQNPALFLFQHENKLPMLCTYSDLFIYSLCSLHRNSAGSLIVVNIHSVQASSVHLNCSAAFGNYNKR